MCITIPAKIIQRNKEEAITESKGRRIKVKLVGDLKIKKGDWVLIYGDLALRKISQKEAEKIIKELP